MQTRSISHANDIASGFVSILNNQQTTNGEIINLGTDEQTTVKYTAECINNYFKNQSDIIFVPAEKIFGNYQEILVRFANITKAEKLLDYKIRKNTNEVIQEICLNVRNKK